MSDEANKPSEREQWEERVIALLFGELDDKTTREVEARLEADDDLRVFRGRMELTLGLVKEAAHTPDLDKEPVPQQLSTDRREALLAKFKVTPLPTRAPRSSTARRIALALVAGFTLLVGVFWMFAPALAKRGSTSAAVAAIRATADVKTVNELMDMPAAAAESAQSEQVVKLEVDFEASRRAEIVLPEIQTLSEEETVAQIKAGTMVAKVEHFGVRPDGAPLSFSGSVGSGPPPTEMPADAYFGRKLVTDAEAKAKRQVDLDFGLAPMTEPAPKADSLYITPAPIATAGKDISGFAKPTRRLANKESTVQPLSEAAPSFAYPTIAPAPKSPPPASGVDRLSRRAYGLGGGMGGGGGALAEARQIDTLQGAVSADPFMVVNGRNEFDRRKLNESLIEERSSPVAVQDRQEAETAVRFSRDGELKQLGELMEANASGAQGRLGAVRLQQADADATQEALHSSLERLRAREGGEIAVGEKAASTKYLAVIPEQQAQAVSGPAPVANGLNNQWFDSGVKRELSRKDAELAKSPTPAKKKAERLSVAADDTTFQLGDVSGLAVASAGGARWGFVEMDAKAAADKAGKEVEDAIFVDVGARVVAGALFDTDAERLAERRKQAPAPVNQSMVRLADEAAGEVLQKAMPEGRTRGAVPAREKKLQTRLGRGTGQAGQAMAASDREADEMEVRLAKPAASPAKPTDAAKTRAFFRQNAPQPNAPAPTTAGRPAVVSAPPAAAEPWSKPQPEPQPEPKPVKREQPKTLKPKPEIATRKNAFSTFSLNVSDVAFKLAKAGLDAGRLPDAETVRSEEFLNAFNYHDPAPVGNRRVSFAWNRARNPFAHDRDLLRFSIQTAARGRAAEQPLNLVVLLDASGSMERADRERIVAEMMSVLVKQLQPTDKISVVSFARTPRLLIDGMNGGDPVAVLRRVNAQTPEGGTNIEAALETAYAIARRHYRANGNNRVILLTDGAANLGDVNPATLRERVEAERKQGVALDCFGVGWEGYNDDLLESLSRNGDGRYGFINDPAEARDGFANLLAGALQVAAADVKAQVEFNPGRVTAWRQIGYDKHQLTKEQFRDNTVDAAEIGAAESGTALYSIRVKRDGVGPLGVVRVRFRVPATGEYVEEQWELDYTPEELPLASAPPAMRLAAVATGFAEWLTANPFAGGVTLSGLERLLNGVPEAFTNDARPRELAKMVSQARRIVGE